MTEEKPAVDENGELSPREQIPTDSHRLVFYNVLLYRMPYGLWSSVFGVVCNAHGSRHVDVGAAPYM